MELDSLKSFGQIAAPAGMAIGVFLYVARDIIAKNISPLLTKERAYNVIMTVVFMAWTVALTGIASWTYVNTRPPIPLEVTVDDPANSPEVVVEQWFREVDAGSYRDAWSSCSVICKKKYELTVFLKLLENQRAPLGNVDARVLTGVNEFSVLPSGRKGNFRFFSYKTLFKSGKSAEEGVLVEVQNNEWKVFTHSLKLLE